MRVFNPAKHAEHPLPLQGEAGWGSPKPVHGEVINQHTRVI